MKPCKNLRSLGALLAIALCLSVMLDTTLAQEVKEDWRLDINTGVMTLDSQDNACFVTSGPENDIYVAKVDPKGNHLWTSRAGTRPVNEHAAWITVDYKDNVIVTGHQVTDGIKLDAPSGVLKGFDAVTGELLWAWDMMNPGWDALPPEGEIYARGTPNMWTTASGDDELGLVYMPMGNSAGDYLSEGRAPAENEYSTSLVAIDVETGEPAWHFTSVYKDVWDYDLGSQPALVDFPGGEGTVPAIIVSSKQGDIYVLDRETGEPLFAPEEREVPQGGVEPEYLSPTQPFSTYHTLAFEPLEEKDMWGMTPLTEGVIQARGHGGARQVNNELILVTGNGGILNYHSTLLLSPLAA